LLIDTDAREIFINGTIDLLFEDHNTVYVVKVNPGIISRPATFRRSGCQLNSRHPPGR
jgi:hypothetical protein